MQTINVQLNIQEEKPENLFSIDNDQITINTDNESSIRIVRKAFKKIQGMGFTSVKLVGDWSREQQYAVIQSFYSPKESLEILFNAKGEDENWLKAHQKALHFVRELTNDTPENMSPENLATKASNWILSLLDDKSTLNVSTITGTELKDKGYAGIYEVGRGSERPPVLLELDFNPLDKNEVDTALIGKGITFDSGGYSIKSSEGMLDMKCDMGGAATVTASLGLAIMLGLKKRVKLFLCCAENLISGHAYKLGDIITYKNGLTVEIVNTDAEGRLVLADGLLAASESEPNQVIDAATLTGAAVMAVGKDYNALFSLDEQLAEKALSCAAEVNEPTWRLPLTVEHKFKCPSPFADTANSRPQKGGGAGGASNAAGFLSRFVPNDGAGWLHFDLAAAYSRNGTEEMPDGASGIGVRTISKILLQP